mmetsp:Transcript_89056/g.287997  ORF Transcript_89056/g.287997 Transcript_89056/m.287997 type:complete len:271 (-) Transcript_89056:202-1014(-)
MRLPEHLCKQSKNKNSKQRACIVKPLRTRWNRVRNKIMDHATPEHECHATHGMRLQHGGPSIRVATISTILFCILLHPRIVQVLELIVIQLWVLLSQALQIVIQEVFQEVVNIMMHLELLLLILIFLLLILLIQTALCVRPILTASPCPTAAQMSFRDLPVALHQPIAAIPALAMHPQPHAFAAAVTGLQQPHARSLDVALKPRFGDRGRPLPADALVIFRHLPATLHKEVTAILAVALHMQTLVGTTTIPILQNEDARGGFVVASGLWR